MEDPDAVATMSCRERLGDDTRFCQAATGSGQVVWVDRFWDRRMPVVGDLRFDLEPGACVLVREESLNGYGAEAFVFLGEQGGLPAKLRFAQAPPHYRSISLAASRSID